MDRLQSMAVFVRVAEQGSFSLAARQLGLSKSAASKHVTALEERLGVRLLNRTTRRLALTEVGAVYRDHCARVVAEAEEADLAASRHSLTPRGRLKVNAPMTFGFLHLGPLLPQFLTAYPAIQVELSLNDRIVDLLEEGFDLAVRIGRLADSSLIARRLATTGFICAAAPAYLARAGAPPSPPTSPAQLPALQLPTRSRKAGASAATARRSRSGSGATSRPTTATRCVPRRAPASASSTYPTSSPRQISRLVSWCACLRTGTPRKHLSMPCSRRSGTPPPSCARSSISWRGISPTGSTGRKVARRRWGGADVQG